MKYSSLISKLALPFVLAGSIGCASQDYSREIEGLTGTSVRESVEYKIENLGGRSIRPDKNYPEIPELSIKGLTGTKVDKYNPTEGLTGEYTR
ncbi:hypothetical protein HYX17_04540 [Candidatus Woesearchaeota archaeon]|nr:hypothetical protein [Candidatus Woesearchaeota archaeon]